MKAGEALDVELHPLVAALLAARGYDTDAAVATYIAPQYEQQLHDPFQLQDMDRAVDRIKVALEQGQRLAVYGDYDIDGITATALLYSTLHDLGATVEWYIPDRFEEGYGLNQAALTELQRRGVNLVISVDCGVTSRAEVEAASAIGLDIIITDHHAVPPELPEAVAVINPKREDDQYPFKDLAGVGVAFKLVQALQRRLGRPELGREKWLLDLVALGTVCDVVTLVGENRVLAKYGLRVLRKTRRVGLQALCAVAGVPLDQLRSYHLGFILGPRLNAAGRLEHAAASLELLLTEDADRALELATKLDGLNRQRQTDQAAILAAAESQVQLYPHDPVLVLADANWSHGIVGIVASKLAERYHKPTLVLQILGPTSKGSGRSIPGFNLVEALREHAGLFSKFGGHAFAAGCTLPSDRIELLRQSLNDYARRILGAGAPQEAGGVVSEAELERLAQVDWDLFRQLELLEPFGNGNQQPIFRAAGLKVVRVERVGRDQNHLKLTLADGDGVMLDAIGFSLADRHPNLREGQKVDALFRITKNEYQQRSSLQLVLEQLT